MIARGKCRAERGTSPLGYKHNEREALKERNNQRSYFALSVLSSTYSSYQGRRASLRSALAPGYHISRNWRCQFLEIDLYSRGQPPTIILFLHGAVLEAFKAPEWLVCQVQNINVNPQPPIEPLAERQIPLRVRIEE